MSRRLPRLLARVLALLIVLALAGLLAAWLALRGSLPARSGEHPLSGLVAPVSIERDALGVATVAAADAADLARGLGWLHGQERFFEMDLSRRAAAGELAALLGGAALAIDRRHRVHRFRARMRQAVAALDPGDRARLQAYAEGVNAGLSQLRARPWPYLLLRERPRPWRAEDSLLVVVAMFFDLQDAGNRRERTLDFAWRHLPTGVYDFIVRPGSALDAALDGSIVPDPAIPSPELLDLRALPAIAGTATDDDQHQPLPGSNNFAVAGRLTGGTAALVANDMHLGLRVPSIWYRARLAWNEAGRAVRLDGVTLPGVPAMVVGSNGKVAWAFTNSYGDWLDLVRLRLDPDDPMRYRDAGGWRPLERHLETLSVRGGADETLEVLESRWGPVIGEDDSGRPLALAWTAHRPGAVDTRLLDLAHADDLDQAMAIAAEAGIPAQNLVAGDASGRIGWILAGRIPVRPPDRDPTRVLDSTQLAGDLWEGWLPADRQPRMVDPPHGRIWTANARVVGDEALALIGDGGYDLGARGAQIRDRLAASERHRESDLLAIQLDDQATLMTHWWRLLRTAIGDGGGDPALAALAAQVEVWDGCACTDSVSYRLVRAFRSRVHDTVLDGLAAPLRAIDPEFRWPRLGQAEGLVRQLLAERPLHLLPPPHDRWDGLLVDAARAVAGELDARPGGLAARTWGEANTARIRHPLAMAMPGWLAGLLSMPATPLPGDAHVPRVQGPSFGASQRMVVAPGREDAGLMHMPGGQTGHPLAPWYGAGHDHWERGEATPLAPGPARWRLTLVPAAPTAPP